MNMNDKMFNIFPDMLYQYMDDMYYGKLHKGRFIGMYMDKIKELDIEDHEQIHLKYPQFVSNDRNDRDNNWLDFVLNLDKPTFINFKNGMEHARKNRISTMGE